MNNQLNEWCFAGISSSSGQNKGRVAKTTRPDYKAVIW
jgi:hypothetical protein